MEPYTAIQNEVKSFITTLPLIKLKLDKLDEVCFTYYATISIAKNKPSLYNIFV